MVGFSRDNALILVGIKYNDKTYIAALTKQKTLAVVVVHSIVDEGYVSSVGSVQVQSTEQSLQLLESVGKIK